MRMKITVRGSVFETNSSSQHTFIHVSKDTFEAWKCGKKVLLPRYFEETTYRDEDFADVDEIKEYDPGEDCDGDEEPLSDDDPDCGIITYNGLLNCFSTFYGDFVSKSEAKKEHVDPEKWEETDDDDDAVYQNPYLEVTDDGKTVTVHMWGRGDVYPGLFER